MQPFRQLACIINPVAGGKKHLCSGGEHCLNNLKKIYPSCIIEYTDCEGREYACVERLVKLQADCVVIFGGDGTIHYVVNAYMKLAPAALPTFAVFPSGSGNDFSRMLKIRSKSFLQSFKENILTNVDLGYITFDKTGEKRWFVNTAGMGLDAEVVHRVNALKTHSSLSYIKAVGNAVAQYKFPTMHIRFNREPIENQHVSNRTAEISHPDNFSVTTEIDEQGTFAMVCNGAYAGNAMHFAPKAQINDGLFDLVFVKKARKPTILAHLPSLYLGKHLSSPLVSYHRARKFYFHSPEAYLQADGEIIGKARCSIEVSDVQLRFITGHKSSYSTQENS